MACFLVCFYWKRQLQTNCHCFWPYPPATEHFWPLSPMERVNRLIVDLCCSIFPKKWTFLHRFQWDSVWWCFIPDYYFLLGWNNQKLWFSLISDYISTSQLKILQAFQFFSSDSIRWPIAQRIIRRSRSRLGLCCRKACRWFLPGVSSLGGRSVESPVGTGLNWGRPSARKWKVVFVDCLESNLG